MRIALSAGALLLCASAALAQTESDRRDYARRTCPMIVRQATLSPATFREITGTIRAGVAGAFDVVLRYEAANRVSVVVRGDATCHYGAAGELPRTIDLDNGGEIGADQIEPLWQRAVDEARAGK